MRITRKQVWALTTVGAVVLTYAIVGTSAFADNAATPTPTATVQATPTVPATLSDQSSMNPTLPLVGDNQDQADGQVGDQSNDVNQSGDNQDGASASD
jgi:hypothetical protein